MLGVVGDVVEDIVVWLEEPFRKGTDTAVSLHRTRGGSAANVAAFAAGLYPTRFIGCVGPDVAGDGLIAELASHGVDVKAQRRGRTGTIVVLIDSDGERSMLPDRGSSVLLREVDPAWTDRLEHLHAPAYSFVSDPLAATAAELLEQVGRSGGTTSLDASSTRMLEWYGRERFFALVADLAPRFLFADHAEAAFLDLWSGLESGLWSGLEKTTVVIKNGARPTTVLEPNGACYRVPVPPIADVRDTTGAGDAFVAGFLSSFLRRHDVRGACEAGHARAAGVLRSPGASLSL